MPIFPGYSWIFGCHITFSSTISAALPILSGFGGWLFFSFPAEINRWLAKGKLRPLIGRVMKLFEAAAAHRFQEENLLCKSAAPAGKIVLTP